MISKVPVNTYVKIYLYSTLCSFLVKKTVFICIVLTIQLTGTFAKAFNFCFYYASVYWVWLSTVTTI